MAPQDATMYWLAGRTRNDLFLLYCFDDAGHSFERLRADVADRVATIDALRVRARDVPRDLDYPYWEPAEFDAEQVIEHQLAQPDRRHLEAALGELVGSVLDAGVHPWRLHIFRGIVGSGDRERAADFGGAPPVAHGPALVVVLQVSHALADGRRAAEIARELFAAAEAASGLPVIRETSGALGAVRAGVSTASRDNLVTMAQVSLRKTRGAAAAVLRLPVHLAENGIRGYQSFRPQRTSAGCGVADRLREAVCSGAAARSVLTSWVSARWVDAAIAVPWLPIRMVRTAYRGYGAFQAQRELADLTAAGELPAPGEGFVPSRVNRIVASGDAVHGVRMLVCAASALRIPGRTVTVVVLTAVSVALGRYLESHGEKVHRLGAQVPMALSDTTKAQAHNNYRSLSVDLSADVVDLRERADKIAATLRDRRIRAQHPLLTAQDRVTEVVPAPLLRRDIARYPLDVVPESIAGHTVVSSVHRGPADLTFGGGRVRWTAGFPAIGSVMHLTHGVHGLGDTITVSVHADQATIPDLDIYTELLRAALDEVTRSLKEELVD
ncbi:WS/DGAT domain-containing protein [Nocardia brasiliensis]|uniref:WS/DGAT domain-containing protein n=1 Tax=Nocardia brasiliensis TaxID=37326 RepID=UPI0024581169|nr:WS/DGAT domain-containing protein [Nocardia brasiliensis]